MISLREITEENFIDAFNLKLGEGQEKYVSHPIRSLAQAYVYREQCKPFTLAKVLAYSQLYYIRNICHTKKSSFLVLM